MTPYFNTDFVLVAKYYFKVSKTHFLDKINNVAHFNRWTEVATNVTEILITSF